MGNDGGSIPDRRDLVRNKPKAEQADKANQTRAKWFFCALSKRPLLHPIVSCALGKLYNKDAILEYLIDKSAYGDGENICGHIRSLKDVETLKLTPNPIPISTVSTDVSTDRAQFVCPLTMKEMNGSQPFVYLNSCGCVFSLAGLRTLSSGSSAPSPPQDEGIKAKSAINVTGKGFELCPQCATKYDRDEDVITLNPSPEEEERLLAIMERRRLLEPVKKSKKRKGANGDDDALPPTKKKPMPTTNPNIAATSRAVVSSLAMEEARRKSEMSAAVKSLYTNGDAPKRKETFMTMGTFTRYA